MLYTLYLLSRYWYVDYVYANGKLANDRGNPIKAHQDLTTAVKLSPNEAIYWNELANSFTDISRSFWENENSESASIFAKQAIEASKKAVSLSPASVNLKRNRASIYIKLSAIDENYLPSAVNEINNAIAIAPTDAKLYYNLGLAYVKLGDNDKALKIFDQTIEMKSNYANARFAKGLVSIDVGDPDTAKYEFEYILKEISPDHKAVKRELDELLDTYY
jgi:tetratricopeptide (TPR) repeat protein